MSEEEIKEIQRGLRRIKKTCYGFLSLGTLNVVCSLFCLKFFSGSGELSVYMNLIPAFIGFYFLFRSFQLWQQHEKFERELQAILKLKEV